MHITPFLSWDLIHVGACHWDDQRQATPCDVPKGVEIRVEPASKTDPILSVDRPWEDGRLGWAQVMEDDGRYRMWYSITPADPTKDRLLCYAESEDGFQWAKPELGLVEVEGGKANNVVFAGNGANHCCVLKCSDGPAETRYRCMYFKSWWEGAPGEELDDAEGHRRLDVKNAAKEGDEVLPVSLKGVMMGMNSPDGLDWRPIEKPILDEWHDTHNICAYDEARKVYVAYLRGFYGGRRAIAYSETPDFENWPPSGVIHHAAADDGPDESLYSNGYTRYPDRPDLRLLFPAIYHQSTDSVYAQLAVSLDGLNWSRLTRQAIVPHGPPGDLDEGHVYPEPDLLRFRRDGKFRMLCRSGPEYHNEWYNESLRSEREPGGCQWAEWQEDRLAGAHAPDEGELTIGLQTCGDRLMANYRTEPGGWLRFELADRLMWPPQPWPGIDGYRFEDMPAMQGDETHALVSWKGSPELPALKGRPVAVRVRLYKATLFATTMYGIDDPLVQDDPRYPV